LLCDCNGRSSVSKLIGFLTLNIILDLFVFWTFVLQQEVKLKSLAETVKESEAKNRALQEQIDQLTEECAKLNAQGIGNIIVRP
jgi:uncharacterized coiled-coil protein SlyX